MLELALGQQYDSVKAFQQAVRALAAQDGWNAKVGDPRYQSALCDHAVLLCRLRLLCPRQINEGRCRSDETEARAQLRRPFSGGKKSSNDDHGLLVSIIKGVMVITPKTSAKEIAQQLKHLKGYQAEKDAVYKAKSAILSEAYGDEVGSFQSLLVRMSTEGPGIFRAPGGVPQLFRGFSRHNYAFRVPGDSVPYLAQYFGFRGKHRVHGSGVSASVKIKAAKKFHSAFRGPGMRNSAKFREVPGLPSMIKR
ncbi:hypothetical protein CF319_g2699 [Tilletia indica]|nr:hypothetical protein CF319_g2699 [Tilletia indica]